MVRGVITGLERAVLPLATIGAATYLLAAGQIDATVAVALISTAAGVGHLTVVAKGTGTKPPPPP